MTTYQGAWSGWLKEVAPLNILDIKYKLDTFHLLSGWLKEGAFANKEDIFVTFDTSQFSILPKSLITSLLALGLLL